MTAEDTYAVISSARMYSAKRLERAVAPTLMLVVFLIGWQIATVWFGIPQYLLPAPTEIIGRFVSDWSAIAYNAAATAIVVLAGFAIATLISVPLALAIASSSSLRRGLFPLIVFFEIIPKTITAPLLIVWFGFGFTPRIVLTTIMTFFPILVNSVAGFSSIDPRLSFITQSMGASSWQSFRYLRVPACMPFIFSGMKIGMVYAVGACLAAEFVGANEGLAYLILSASSYMDISLMFSGVLAAAVLGMMMTGALLALERLIMPWRDGQQT